MMQKDFAVYKSLIKVLILNTFRSGRTSGNRKKRNILSGKAGMLIGCAAFGLYAALMSGAVTATAVTQGMEQEVLYTLIAMAQLIVLFFGAIAVLGYIYFSNDNNLLSSLPIHPTVIFAARFSMAYLSELAFSLLLSVPMLTTYGIICMNMGVDLAWHFFLVMLLAVPLLPMIPLFFITLLSLPVMSVVSRIKKSTLGSSIAIGFLYAVGMGLYFGFIFGSQALMQTSGDITVISAGGMKVFSSVKNITFFNYNLIQALSNNNVLLNTFIYLASNFLLFGIVILLSSIFYKRVIASLAEGVGIGKKKKNAPDAAVSYVKMSVYKSFFIKEVRTLLNTPMLLISTLMGMIMPPVLMALIAFSMGAAIGGEEAYMDQGLFMTGFSLYIGFLMIGSTNVISTVGISREGRQLYILKTLPLPVRTIIRCKLMFASIITCISTIILSVSYPFIFGITNPVAIILFPAALLTGGIGVNCLALHSDLKKPKLDWSNVSELTRNNKNTLRFMLPVLLIGFMYLILGIILGIQTTVSSYWAYVILFGFAMVPSSLLLLISWTRLFKNPEALFDKIGD
jgi:ABC-2 type transport system permease protein